MTGRAVVIGGAGQVGRAVARRLRDAGWTVGVVGRGRTPVPADLTGCGHVLPVGFDVAGVEAMLDYAAEDRYLASVTPAARRPPGPTPRSAASPRPRPRRPG